MKKPTIIGILGGMGPKSTAPFLNMVIEQCEQQYGAKNDIDFPHIIIYSLPTPFYIGKPINHSKLKEVVLNGLKKLEKMGAAFIAMPCNTTHAYYEELNRKLHIPLLNIADETVAQIPKKSKVAIMATRSTIQSNLYQSKLNQDGIQFIGSLVWQGKIDQVIQQQKSGKQSQKTLAALLNILKKQKVDTIILACTDLTRLITQIKGFKVVDSSKALAEATIKTYLKLNK